MSKGQKKSKKAKPGKFSRSPRGRVVHIGPRPKMPLIITGVFVAGVVMMILATLLSPKKTPEPTAPAASTNAPATNAPTAASPAPHAPSPANAPAR